jgi:hypothetical protein
VREREKCGGKRGKRRGDGKKLEDTGAVRRKGRREAFLPLEVNFSDSPTSGLPSERLLKLPPSSHPTPPP